MNIYDFATNLLFEQTIEEKLLDGSKIDTSFTLYESITTPKVPGRVTALEFSEKQFKFPRGSSVGDPSKMAKALHFFANHELLAIEMMAAAILIYPTNNKDDHDFKIGLLATILDEQKHLGLYIKRMNELGTSFGDFPLNDFFWKHLYNLKTPSEFYALMALTFETANLDFALHFNHLFAQVGDIETSNIMKIVYEDEVKHVSRGAVWLNRWRGDKSLWQYYVDCLPEFVTPARAKGNVFDSKGRSRAGLTDEFIDSVKFFKDDFKITNRKQWK